MSDISVIARHAVTVLAGQLAVMAFGVTDTIVAGRFSADALAALSVASAVFVSVYVSLMGVLQALLPVWAEQHGRGETAAIGQSFRQSLYLAAAASVLGMGVLLFPEPLLRLTEVPDAMRESVRDYLIIVGWALPSALFFRLYTTLNQALGRPQLVTWIQVGALVLKVPLSIWFTFGGWGIAPQGAAGCAWATLLVDYAIAIAAVVLMRTQGVLPPAAPVAAPGSARLAAPARVFAPGHPGRAGDWGGGDLVHPGRPVRRPPGHAVGRQPPDCGQPGRRVLHAAAVAGHCRQRPRQLVARPGAGAARPAGRLAGRAPGPGLRHRAVRCHAAHAPLAAPGVYGRCCCDGPHGLAIAVGGAVPGGRQRAMRVHFCAAQLARDAGAAARLLHLAVGRWPRGWVLACLHKQSYFR